MPAPFAPSDLLPSIVDRATDDLGVGLTKAHLTFPTYFAQWYEWAFVVEGDSVNISPAFREMICAIDCPSLAGEIINPMNIPTPNQIKELIPGVGGDLCEKFDRALDLPQQYYNWYAAVFTEQREFTDEFKAAICALGCSGVVQPPVNPSGLGTPVIAASDGAFADKVRITWAAITDATAYRVYRYTGNNSSLATLIGSPTGTTYDDTTAVSGTTYYYWVKATDGVAFSNFSNPDTGYVGVPTETLDAVSDLAATQGFAGNSSGLISLVFTPVPGAESYSFYRSEVNDFSDLDDAAVTLIEANRVPFLPFTATSLTLGTTPLFIDNIGELVYYHDPGGITEAITPYYFAVVAHKTSPPAISPVSNSALGWVVGFSDGVPYVSIASYTTGVAGEFCPAGSTEARFVLRGPHGGGAGGSAARGGGGGGGRVIMTGVFACLGTGADKVRVVSSPEADSGYTPALTNASAITYTRLEYSALGDFSDTIVIASAPGGLGGEYDAAGGGAGGAAAVAGTFHGSVTEQATYLGHDGVDAGTGSASYKGGKSGYGFGEYRLPAAHFNGFTSGYDGAGGGGSFATQAPTDAPATGGKAMRGNVNIAYRA